LIVIPIFLGLLVNLLMFFYILILNIKGKIEQSYMEFQNPWE